MEDSFAPIGFAGLLLAEINIESIFSIILMAVLILSGIASLIVTIVQAIRNDHKIDDQELEDIKRQLEDFTKTVKDMKDK